MSEPLAMRSDRDVVPLSIAPMIQWTDRHWRFFFRLISKKTLLYSEMIMDNALIHNPNTHQFLGHSAEEHPLAIQLGGCEPETLGKAVQLCEQFGQFHEINLNCGCPSNKAKKAGFGAELMLDPDLVRQIVHEMNRRATSTAISVKCRLGVTGRESWEELLEFIHAVKAGGVNRLIVHSRHCELKGLSPAQNRTVPPLHYEWVHRLVKIFPDMTFVLNGGVTSQDQIKEHLASYTFQDEVLPAVHGVMVGREAYNNPFSFRHADSTFFGSPPQDYADLPSWSRGAVLEEYLDYAVRMQEEGVYGSNTCNLIKPMHNFFTGCTGNILYKQTLDRLLQRDSKLIDAGKLRLDDFVWSCVDQSMPKEALCEDIVDRRR